MGTRCVTYFFDKEEDTDPFFCLYRQFDGYREAHGVDLSDFLCGKTLVNGIPGGVDKSTLANGMGCLAAQFVAKMKTDVGNFYIYAPKLGEDHWQDYEYHVWPNLVRVFNGYDVKIFEGTWSEFQAWCNSDDDEEDS
jgi:hypothetical protein